ncbi:hypothetical protein [Baekduia sp. Peel2402]|uniref:hypothetical protein n=1 Tax=Baekduia sp. Peel2402 TaxID=3458296 RepID=UPI00403E442F
MLAVSLTSSDWIQVTIAGITGMATLAALANLLLARANERRRNQPVVIAHEAGSGRRFAHSNDAGVAWVVDAYLTSEGGGPAFNVRFGVEFAGVRYPYRLDVNDPDSGNLQRVLRPGDQRPERGAWSIPIPFLSMPGRIGDARSADKPDTVDKQRVYWARYENAEGQTWETRNPGDRSTPLDIRRVRRPKRHERRERKALNEAAKRDREWERAVLAELEAERQKAVAAERAQGRSKGAPEDG